VADCAADVRAICAGLGIARLGMRGISGGGPHLLACAALLPDLVTAAASLAALAPSDAAGLDWFDGMGQDNVDDFKLQQSDKVAARAKLEDEREANLAASGEDLAGLLMHGRQDQFVPSGHGQWLAARIPGVEARLLDDDGHLTLITSRIGEVHAWLAERI
jgi:pimeloyl-ACP methyl ester carboxylesterase